MSNYFTKLLCGISCICLIGCSNDEEYHSFVCHKNKQHTEIQNDETITHRIHLTLNIRVQVHDNFLNYILGHTETSSNTTVIRMNKIREEVITQNPHIVNRVYEHENKQVRIFVLYNKDTNKILNLNRSGFTECIPHTLENRQPSFN